MSRRVKTSAADSFDTKSIKFCNISAEIAKLESDIRNVLCQTCRKRTRKSASLLLFSVNSLGWNSGSVGTGMLHRP